VHVTAAALSWGSQRDRLGHCLKRGEAICRSTQQQRQRQVGGCTQLRHRSGGDQERGMDQVLGGLGRLGRLGGDGRGSAAVHVELEVKGFKRAT
jgi:hypothetical protein